ncbi:hypothetical protein NL676_003474 [Syzygium grande]|nr:hypothetical protein NL676_003474 [Syzygium grande]
MRMKINERIDNGGGATDEEAIGQPSGAEDVNGIDGEAVIDVEGNMKRKPIGGVGKMEIEEERDEKTI